MKYAPGVLLHGHRHGYLMYVPGMLLNVQCHCFECLG